MVGNNQKKNTTYVFVDASNVWSIVKSARKFIEYKNLKSYFEKKFNSNRVEVFYYGAYPKEGTREYDLGAKHRFFTYLKKGLGFVVRKKELKRISVHNETGDAVEEKGNMDVEITLDAVHHRDSYDTAIFFTGDSDFLALITYLRSAGKKVYIFSSKNNISHELKTGGDGYIDILTMTDDIWGRELVRRPLS